MFTKKTTYRMIFDLKLKQTSNYKYSRTPEIETADLSQYQTDCMLITYKLKYRNFKLFESMLGIITTTMTNEKYWYLTLLKIFINWYVMPSLFFFINDEYIT